MYNTPIHRNSLWTLDKWSPTYANFRITHFTHRSTPSFHSFHSAFYLPHSTFRSSAFYQLPVPGCIFTIARRFRDQWRSLCLWLVGIADEPVTLADKYASEKYWTPSYAHVFQLLLQCVDFRPILTKLVSIRSTHTTDMHCKSLGIGLELPQLGRLTESLYVLCRPSWMTC